MVQEIYIIDDDDSSIVIFRELFKNDKEYKFISVKSEQINNTITPVIVVSSNSNKEHRMKILKESIEYYIKKPVDEEYLYYTVKNLNRLLAINRRISPLTGLPGNVQIHAELKKRLSNKEAFSVLYLDIMMCMDF